MMITWMMAAVLFTLCLGVAAAATERLLRGYGRAARGAWVVALAVAVSWPVLVPAIGPYFTVSALESTGEMAAPSAANADAFVIAPDNAGTLWSQLAAMTRSIDAQAQRVSAALSAHSSWLNPAALAVWGVLSGLLLLRLVMAARHVHRLTQRATPAVIDGDAVLLAEEFGPASVGWRTPRVVVPPWVLALDTPLRALVLRHETEHCRSRDPRLVWYAAVATAVMPWNVGLWWLARRLRLALELDCDVRTLQHGGDPRTYAKLLLFMTQQHAAPAAHFRLASSLAASRSHLATRIKAMQENSKLTSRGARMVAVAIGALAVIGASATRIPDVRVAPDTPLPQVPAADTIYFEFQVEKPAAMRPGSNRMVYPEMLRSAQVEGVVLASFVVNEEGVADLSTFKVLKSDHDLFTAAVRTALPNIGYIPAENGGKRVKQLVQQPFVFSLARKEAAAAPSVISVPSPSRGAPIEGAATPTKPADAYFEFQVEKPATMSPGASGMVYPAMLRAAQVEGTVLAQFVVDEAGVVEMSTFKVIRSDHELFSNAVRIALAEMRFVPAEIGGKKVKQMVQQPFVFSLSK